MLCKFLVNLRDLYKAGDPTGTQLAGYSKNLNNLDCSIKGMLYHNHNLRLLVIFVNFISLVLFIVFSIAINFLSSLLIITMIGLLVRVVGILVNACYAYYMHDQHSVRVEKNLTRFVKFAFSVWYNTYMIYNTIHADKLVSAINALSLEQTIKIASTDNVSHNSTTVRSGFLKVPDLLLMMT